jgi:hypothetical protein
MTHCGHEHRQRDDRDRAGSAAEDFARRIARDAQRFGERVAEHATEFARNVTREWQHGPGFDTTPLANDVRGVLKEVRGLVADVIDGVDELIGRVFHGEPEDAEARWARVVTNREITCAACGRGIGAGEECHLLRGRDTRAFRCVQCGPPKPAETPPPPGA